MAKKQQEKNYGVLKLGTNVLQYFSKQYGVVQKNGTLFLGLIFVASGILSFRSDKYCEGNSNDYYACVNPSTYYYYPAISIVLVVAGVVLIALWKLNRK